MRPVSRAMPLAGAFIAFNLSVEREDQSRKLQMACVCEQPRPEHATTDRSLRFSMA
jgi:hypothetical protein